MYPTLLTIQGPFLGVLQAWKKRFKFAFITALHEMIALLELLMFRLMSLTFLMSNLCEFKHQLNFAWIWHIRQTWPGFPNFVFKNARGSLLGSITSPPPCALENQTAASLNRETLYMWSSNNDIFNFKCAITSYRVFQKSVKMISLC